MEPDEVELSGDYDPSSPPSIPTLEQFIALVKNKNLARTERFFVDFSIPDADSNKVRDLSLLCDEAALPGKKITTRTLRINGLDEYRAHTVDYDGEITLGFLIDTDWTAKLLMEKWMHSCVDRTAGRREVGFYNDYAHMISMYALMPAGIPGSKIASFSPTQSDTGLTTALSSIASDDANPIANTAINRLMMRGRKTVDTLSAKAKSQTLGRLRLASNPLVELFREAEMTTYGVHLHDCFPTAINVMPMSFSNPGVHRMNVTFSYKFWRTSVITNPDTIEDKFISAVGDKLKKYSDKIPMDKLSSFGNDLKEKATAFRRGRFGG